MNDHGLAWAETMRDRREPPEPEPKRRCDHCREPIYEGDPIYRINGEIFCEKCAWDLYGGYA